MKVYSRDGIRAPGRMLGLRFAGVWLALSLTFAVPAADLPASEQTLHAAMIEQLESQGLQGAVWSTVTDDGTIATDAAGVKDAGRGVALRADDRVHIGSIAKTLLATGVLRLVSEGRLALDTPVSELLPAIAFDNPWASTDPVRVRHLLDHTAGLDDARFSQVFSLNLSADTPLMAAFAGHMPLDVRSRPGSRHSYSNTSYTLLGMVIETVTGTRYEAYLDVHLLHALGMRDSTFGFVTQTGARADARLAMGHFEKGAPHAAVPTFLRPAGQFTTTAADMARFAQFLMSDGRIDGQPFVDAALLQAMGQPVGTEAAETGLRVGYGLGLATRDRHGAVGKCHGGSTVGYQAMLCLFPEHRRAFFVAVNADIEGADYGRFDRLLVQALRVQAAPQPSKATTADIEAWEGYYIPAPNRFASLAWLDTTLNFVRVRKDGDALRFKPFQSAEVVLAPVGGALFRIDGRTMASHALLVAQDGQRVITTSYKSYRQVPLTTLAPLWASLIAGLLGLLWLLVIGLVRLARRGSARSQPAFVPFIGVALLLLPLPFFYRQSFLQLGDFTLASGLLAAVTLLLPITMLIGLWRSFRRRPWSVWATLDAGAMLAVLQWTAVLAWWELMPLRLWS